VRCLAAVRSFRQEILDILNHLRTALIALGGILRHGSPDDGIEALG